MGIGDTQRTDNGAGLIDLPIINTYSCQGNLICSLFAHCPGSHPKHHRRPCDAQTDGVLHHPTAPGTHHATYRLQASQFLARGVSARQPHHASTRKGSKEKMNMPKWIRHARARCTCIRK